MANISNNDIAKAIYESSKDKHGSELNTTLSNVTKFLARKRLLLKVPDILRSLQNIINKEEGRLEVSIQSVRKLSEIHKAEIEHSLKERYGVKEVILNEKIDDKLIGGIRIEMRDEVIDLSIKNRIGQLQEYLTRTI